ncbi:hypothetical protein [Breoghania sp. L-A4]|uniref:hypothetical protein n=1 Tax=Breoghania sp. L-A4 TaxID=2304600 RepID=UPI0013C33442|nr:hypothetical protein [Breoghania sp. L-A4]
MAVLNSTLRVGLDDRLTGKGRGLFGMLNRLSGQGGGCSLGSSASRRQPASLL